jgi:hypothetical protein
MAAGKRAAGKREEVRARMDTVHRWVGIATIVAFLITGLYMRLNSPDYYRSDETIRFMFRANHIYITQILLRRTWGTDLLR